MASTKKYEVEILEKKGSCESATFEKMAKNGDIASEKVTECVGKVITLTGYALCHITAGEKEYFIYVFYCYNKTQEVLNKRELSIA